jgi:hypothetical protein
MIGEVDILGVFIPALLWMMLIAWHRSIFDLGLYVIVLGIIVSLTHR